jgi:ABC-type transporter Mla subunit MlaD
MEGVYVTLKIYDEVKIPSASEFTVGSSGLLGDKFVQVELLKDAKDSPPIAPGTTIQGKSESGFADIMNQAGPVIDEVRAAVKNINSIAAKLDSDVFRKSTMDDLNATMANLKETSASFAEASKKIDGVMEQAKGAIGTGQKTFVSAKDAADELKKALVDVRSLLQQAKQGRGAIGVLLSDREVAHNLRSLVANLKEHGILWYKDRSSPPDSTR